MAGLESPARADRFAIGASIGSSKDEGGTASVPSRGVLGRVKLSSRFALEGTIEGVDRPDHAQGVQRLGDGLRAMAAARYDLGTGALAPFVIGAVGAERWRNDYMEFGYWRREIGAGLDVRISDGLHLGVEVRTGIRAFIGRRQTEKFVAQIYIPEPFSTVETGYLATRLTLTAAF